MTNCPDCEYHKDRAARWRAEAYKQAGHDVIELPWVGLTDEERESLLHQALRFYDTNAQLLSLIKTVEIKLKEKNT